MKRPLGIFAVLVLVSTSFAQTVPTKPGGAIKAVESAAIDEYLTAKVKETGTVGLSVAVYREGLPVISKVYGVTSVNGGSPLRTDIAFAIGSITKQFTCAAIFLLNEEGKLFYRDNVSKYYPNLTRANDINLYDLMTHCSGYRDYYPLDFIDRRMMKPIMPDTLIQQYCSAKLDFEPGTRWSYSNTGYIILGRVIEKASDEQLGKYMERHILKPLRMDHSFFEPAADSPNVARGHTSVLLGPAENVPLESPQWLHAAGGLFCTANDLAKWDLALMSGRFLKSDSFNTMITPRELKDGRLQNYGCGLAVLRRDGELVLSHGGAVSGFHAYNTMIPRTKSIVIVLCNDELADVGAIHNDLVALLLREQGKREDTVPKVQGVGAKEAAIALFKQMQTGAVDRGQIGEEFNVYLTDSRLRDAAPRLKEYGEPTSVEVQGLRERGNLEACTVRFTFKNGVINANMFRSTDGKVQQFLLGKS
jgi:CubicO group peptidase (beta-lactamase class C family)